MKEPKTTLVVLLKSGASITTKCVMSQQEVMSAYQNAKLDGIVDLRIETGDDKNNIMYFRVEDISLLSIMDYVDEKKAAQGHGIMKPNSGLIVPR